MRLLWGGKGQKKCFARVGPDSRDEAGFWVALVPAVAGDVVRATMNVPLLLQLAASSCKGFGSLQLGYRSRVCRGLVGGQEAAEGAAGVACTRPLPVAADRGLKMGSSHAVAMVMGRDGGQLLHCYGNWGCSSDAGKNT